MFNEVVAETNIVVYLMTAVGMIGILAKLVNHFTLRRMVSAAGNMPKSTHKLIKLVRAKHEHACMLHDKVENVSAFVEKYIYEYRGFLFRIHTWRQLEIQSVWFAGILAILGAVSHYMSHGLCEQVYQYGAAGAAEMLLLFIVSQLSDEQYKTEAVKNYIVDYLENSCVRKHRRVRQAEKEQIDVIHPETVRQNTRETEETAPELSISIEGEPRQAQKRRGCQTSCSQSCERTRGGGRKICIKGRYDTSDFRRVSGLNFLERQRIDRYKRL